MLVRRVMLTRHGILVHGERGRRRSGSSPARIGAPLATMLLVLLAVVACGGGGKPAAASGPKSPYDGLRLQGAYPAPDFALRDQHRRLIRLSAERDRFVIVTFLYTHCPDVCPLIAENLNGALRQLGSARSSVRVLAVSVDPKGDTPQAVQHFVHVHRLLPEFHYLTGTAPHLRPIWQDFNVLADPNNADTAVTHSAFSILIDRSGIQRLFYDSRANSSEVVHDIRVLSNEH